MSFIKGLCVSVTLTLLVFTVPAVAGPNADAILSLDLVPGGGAGNRMDDGVTSGTASGQGAAIAVEVFAKGVATPLVGVAIKFEFDGSLLRLVKAENPAFGFTIPEAAGANFASQTPVTLSSAGFLARAEFVTLADASGREFSIGIESVVLAQSRTSSDVLATTDVVSFGPASTCPGDFDNSGTVDFADFLAFVPVFGKRSGDAGYNGIMDLDGSGAVDFSDFLAFVGQFGVTCEPPTPPASSDRDALVALYNATDGANWRFNVNWLSDRPLGEWYGVTTDAGGRVTHLRLYAIRTSDGDTVEAGNSGTLIGNGLSGAIPPELGGLSELKQLWLSRNPLTGAIPPELGSLTNLEWLHLAEARLSGPIPPELGRLTSLQLLYLFGNQLTGAIPPELGDLTNLRSLLLRTNRLTGPIPSEFGGLANLQLLYLAENELTGALPPELGSLSNLRWLLLNANGLTGPIPSQFGALTNLRRLHLDDNQLTGNVPRELGRLANLRGLGMSNNSGLSGSLPATFTALDSLVYLYVDGTTMCAPTDAAFQAWLQGIASTRGVVDCEGAVTDYDSDDDGLIEVVNLAQLNAIRWDLDGDGAATANHVADYAAAFPGAVTGMGCPDSGCTGYELHADLDFDTNGDDDADSGDVFWNEGVGWDPIGGDNHEFSATFDGNEHNVANLHIDRESGYLGLFAATDSSSDLRNVGLLKASVTGRRGWNVGGLVGANRGNIDHCYVDAGNIAGIYHIGGLVGFNAGPITHSYATADVAGQGAVGGLVGEGCIGPIANSHATGSVSGAADGIGGLVGRSQCEPNRSPITSSYATGNVAGRNAVGGLVGAMRNPILASYATGNVTGDARVGGLVGGTNTFSTTITASYANGRVIGNSDVGGLVGYNFVSGLQVATSYWDTQTSGQTSSAGGIGKTTSELQTPTGYSGIYAAWNVDLDGDDVPDDPWDFGSATQYPVLRFQDRGPDTGAVSDRDALVALYNATDGANWSKKTNWLSQEPLSEWHGVTTDESGRVSLLDLRSNRVTGAIPVELGSLSSLQRAWLSGNRLTGAIPASLGILSSLQELLLHGNQLTGTIPVELGSLSNLTRLYLQDNDLTGPIPEELGSLSNLQRLWLGSNQLTGTIPASLSSLSNLKQLILTNNAGFSGPLPGSFTSLRSLTHLYLDGTGVCAPPDDGFRAWLRGIDYRRGIAYCSVSSGLGAYVVQTTQTLDRDVPLVAGEDALLRVFISVNPDLGAKMPPVRATFFLGGAVVSDSILTSPGSDIPAQIDEGSLSASVNALVSGDIIQPGLEMLIEIDPAGLLDPALRISGRRLPASGRISLDVRSMPPFELTVLPFLWLDERDDRSTVDTVLDLTANSALFRLSRDLLPVGDFTLDIGPIVYVDVEPNFDNSGRILSNVGMMRKLLGAGDQEHFKGILNGSGGSAFVGGNDSVSGLYGGTIAHELGHNMNLWHAPCGRPGGPFPKNTDSKFPSDGKVGAWGYDRSTGMLVSPETPDLMSYCGPPDGISVYGFNRAMEHRLSQAAPKIAADESSNRGLLLSGGVDSEGELFLEPAYVVNAPGAFYRLNGPYFLTLEYQGTEFVSYIGGFAMEQHSVDESGSFVFIVPFKPRSTDKPGSVDLVRVRLSGPEGETTLEKQDTPAGAILLDSTTGKVRGILEKWPIADGDEFLEQEGLDANVSYGIPRPSDW